MGCTMLIRTGDWHTLGSDACAVRHEVFVVEQNVPLEIEQDDRDAVCVHAVAYDGSGRAVGTGRLLPDAHIGRMAVLRRCRGQGVGSQLLRALIHEARLRSYPEVILSAQMQAIAFYERHGFIAEGEPYRDAGIEHMQMRRPL